MSHDPVNHPTHYTSHPSGVEAIEICQYLDFCAGNAVKYLWRAGLKNDRVEDLKKALWYVNAKQRIPYSMPPIKEYYAQLITYMDNEPDREVLRAVSLIAAPDDELSYRKAARVIERLIAK